LHLLLPKKQFAAIKKQKKHPAAPGLPAKEMARPQ